jgi:hypothetical protein
MIVRTLSLGRLAALLLCCLAFGAVPAKADGCGYYGCYRPAPVVAQPVVPACSCCGCGSAYYASYYPAYTFPSFPFFPWFWSASCCGYGYGYDYGYIYGNEGPAGFYDGGTVPPPNYWRYGPRARYWGPERYIGTPRGYVR